jgi:hypothetical protein
MVHSPVQKPKEESMLTMIQRSGQQAREPGELAGPFLAGDDTEEDIEG